MSQGALTQTTRTMRATCVHHWVIDSPSGRESRGTCKHCGKSKVFANSTENVMWEQTNTVRNDLRNVLRIPRVAEDITLSDEE